MAKLTGNAGITNINLYSSESVPSSAVGQRVAGAQGTEFRYVKAGASALVVGNALQSPAFGTNWNALTLQSDAAIGATTIKVTNSANAVTLDQFKYGTLTIDAGTGIGQTFTILGNTADASGSATLTITVAEPVRVALAVADTKVTLMNNVCDGVIQCPTTLTGVGVGVAIYPIPAGKYGWIQTKGQCATLSDSSTFAIGSDVGLPGAAAGSVGVNVAGTGKSNIVGKAMQANSSGHTIPIELCF